MVYYLRFFHHWVFSRIASKIRSAIETFCVVISAWRTEILPSRSAKTTCILNAWGIFSFSYFQSKFSKHPESGPSQGCSSSAHLDQYFMSFPWKMHSCCLSMKIVIRSMEQQEPDEYPRLSWDVAGLGKGEADVDPTELIFVFILSIKNPVVKGTEMERKGTIRS